MHPLKVSLEELYNGTTKKLSLAKNVVCSKCEGCDAARALPLCSPAHYPHSLAGRGASQGRRAAA